MRENSLYFTHMLADSKLFLDITRILIASKEYVPETDRKVEYNTKDLMTMTIFENICKLFASLTHLKENGENMLEAKKIYYFNGHPEMDGYESDDENDFPAFPKTISVSSALY